MAKKSNHYTEKLARRAEKGARWFEGKPNIHKVIFAIGFFAILGICIWKASMIFWYLAIGWVVYAIGRKMIGKKHEERQKEQREQRIPVQNC